jgi:hypothetical protein
MVLALSGIALAALPPGPAAARSRGSSFSRSGFGRPVFSRPTFSRSAFSRPAFRNSHVGISFGNRNFRVNLGFNSYRGYRHYRSYPGYPYVTYPYVLYPPLYSGVYYGNPYLSVFNPYYLYNYSALPPTRTVYIYPPPEVRTYTEERQAPVIVGGSGARRDATPSTHPYDEPVSPSPEKGSVDEALADIRAAWEKSDVTLLEAHLPEREEIALYRDGTLRQELKPDEFLRLNRDAFREIRTVRFRFTEVRRPAADEAKATAIHTYVVKDAGDDTQTAILHYDLLRRDGVWTLRAVHVVPGA